MDQKKDISDLESSQGRATTNVNITPELISYHLEWNRESKSNLNDHQDGADSSGRLDFEDLNSDLQTSINEFIPSDIDLGGVDNNPFGPLEDMPYRCHSLEEEIQIRQQNEDNSFLNMIDADTFYRDFNLMHTNSLPDHSNNLLQETCNSSQDLASTISSPYPDLKDQMFRFDESEMNEVMDHSKLESKTYISFINSNETPKSEEITNNESQFILEGLSQNEQTAKPNELSVENVANYTKREGILENDLLELNTDFLYNGNLIAINKPFDDLDNKFMGLTMDNINLLEESQTTTNSDNSVDNSTSTSNTMEASNLLQPETFFSRAPQFVQSEKVKVQPNDLARINRNPNCLAKFNESISSCFKTTAFDDESVEKDLELLESKEAAENHLKGVIYEEILAKIKMCCNPTFKCTLSCVNDSNFCIRHVLLDANAPYTSCSYKYSNGKVCFNAKPRNDGTEFCSLHNLEIQKAKSLPEPPMPQPDVSMDILLNQIKHHIEFNDDDFKDEYETDDDFIDVDDYSAPFDLGMHAAGLETVSSMAANNEWQDDSVRLVSPPIDSPIKVNDDFVDSSDEDLTDDVDDEDPLRYAVVYTPQEIIQMTLRSTTRLNQLYKEEMESLERSYEERRSIYLAECRREQNTLCRPSNQPIETFEDQHAYDEYKAYSRHNSPNSLQNLLLQRRKDKAAKEAGACCASNHSAGTNNNLANKVATKSTRCQTVCYYMDDKDIRCKRRALPCTKYCWDHILKDRRQVLFKCCNNKNGNHTCKTPYIRGFDGYGGCSLHQKHPFKCEHKIRKNFKFTKMKGFKDEVQNTFQFKGREIENKKRPRNDSDKANPEELEQFNSKEQDLEQDQGPEQVQVQENDNDNDIDTDNENSEELEVDVDDSDLKKQEKEKKPEQLEQFVKLNEMEETKKVIQTPSFDITDLYEDISEEESDDFFSDHDKDEFKNKEKENIPEPVKEENKDQVKGENTEQVKGENTEQVKGENREQVKKENKDQAKIENKERIKYENIDQVKGGNKDQVKDKNKDQLKDKNKDQVKGENKDQVKSENRELVKEANKEQVKGENKERIKFENIDQIKSENKDQVKGENKDQVKGENKDQVKGENKEQVKGENKQHIKYENKDQIKGENKVRVKGENKQHIKYENKDLLKGENKDQVQGENKDLVKGENKQHIKYENKDQGKYKNKDLVKGENKDQVKGENKDQGKYKNKDLVKGENKDQVRGENKDQVRGENKDQVKGENKEQVKGQNKQHIKYENKEQIKGENKVRVKGENKDQGKDKNKDLVKGENKDQVQGENKDQVKSENKDQVKGENKDQVKGGNKDQVKDKNKDQVKVENKERIKYENIEQVKGENKPQVLDKNKNQVKGENKPQIKGENKDQITDENKELIKYQNEDQVKGENKNHVNDENRDQFTCENKDQVIGENKWQIEQVSTAEEKFFENGNETIGEDLEEGEIPDE